MRQKAGVSFFWLDWCCDASVVSSAGVTPDAWIDHLYAQDMVNLGERGFVGGLGAAHAVEQRKHFHFRLREQKKRGGHCCSQYQKNYNIPHGPLQ